MAKILRALAHLFTAPAYHIASFPARTLANDFARGYLGRTGARVAVMQDGEDFIVVRVGGL